MAFDRFRGRPVKPEEGPRINDQIRITPLRVVNEKGEMLGVISRDEALEAAAEAGMDLVEVSSTERPPVCKIMDYGKFKFEQTKKVKKNKATQTTTKEIRIRPQVGKADLEVKMKRAREFLEEKNKVILTCQFKGRENRYVEIGIERLREMIELLSDIAKVERAPTKENRRVTALLAPR